MFLIFERGSQHQSYSVDAAVALSGIRCKRELSMATILTAGVANRSSTISIKGMVVGGTKMSLDGE